jgi:hypothetical protein
MATASGPKGNLMRTRVFDRDKIIRMDQDGFTPKEIQYAIGAKSTYHIKAILQKYKREKGILPPAKEKPGIHVEPTPVPLDVRKVKALQKAGWPMAKIVDEFGYNFTAEQIREALTR